MKTAILGGTFNPVHNGHLALADDTRRLGYDRVVFVPACRPPHKDVSYGASDSDRVAMLELALAGIGHVLIWQGELRRGGVSYTIDTVRQLKIEGIIDQVSRPGLIIGDDLIGGFGKWREVDRLVVETEIILARRTVEYDLPFPYPCIRLRNRIWPCTSTAIRNAVRCGGDPTGLLPEAVMNYILEKGLYGHQTT